LLLLVLCRRKEWDAFTRAASIALFIVLFTQSATIADEGPSLVAETARGFTVRADGVTALDALRQIGARAGFTVIDAGAGQALMSAEINDAPLDTILRVLLRGEHHLIVYGAVPAMTAAPAIEKIVMFGQADAGAPAGDTADSLTLADEAGDRSQRVRAVPDSLRNHLLDQIRSLVDATRQHTLDQRRDP